MNELAKEAIVILLFSTYPPQASLILIQRKPVGISMSANLMKPYR
ncbi:MAG: hypothetical protein Q7T50_01130 [Candidatus Magasanikbacteria bacterium]|nr:hypothetical protein [Candidatus Magasanikbacteria bacterium]